MVENTFSWQKFESMTRVLESLGIVVVVLGPLTGIVLLILGDFILRVIGVAIILGSFLIALYHISFSLLMGGIRDVIRQLETNTARETE